MKPLNILVTAVGGDVGQAIVKALRLSSLDVNLHGADANADGIGAAFVDALHMLPLARDVDAYLAAIDNLQAQFAFDVIIPASEAEISVLGEHSKRLVHPECLLMQPREWIDSFADKLTGMQKLSAHVPLVLFADASKRDEVDGMMEQVSYPVVVKSRRGFGSKTVGYAKDAQQLNTLIEALSPAVVMDFIPDSGGEFSVGVFRMGASCRVLPVKRSLGNVGCTWYGEVVDDREVADYAERIAVASDLQGAANIQVRKNKDGVFLLEINPRLSSLTAARAAAGFNDAEWWVRMHLGLSIDFPTAYHPIRFQRYFSEMIDRGNGWESISAWRPGNTKG